MAHPPELRQQASELRSGGMLIREIAVELNVPESTVIRWLNPKLERRERANAKRRKFSRKRRCPKCGNKVSDKALICRSCQREAQSKDRYWNRERIIDAIRAWALQHGHAPTYKEWEKKGKGHPATLTVHSGMYPPFASWSDALRAAGFEPRKRRSALRLTNEERAAVRRKRREDILRQALEKENNEGAMGTRS